MASPEHLERLEKTDISRLQQFVTCIIFEGQNVFVDSHFGGKPPLSDNNEEIEEKFESRVSRANETKMLFDSGHVGNLWSAALRSLPNVGNFEISNEEYGVTYNDSGPVEGAAPIDDVFFVTTVEILGSIGRNISSLEVRYIFSESFDWVCQPKWTNINIKSIKNLILCSGYGDLGENHSPTKHESLIPCTSYSELFQLDPSERYAVAITSILNKCRHSLEELYIYSDEWREGWPREGEAVALPKLQILELGELSLQPTAFAALLENAKSLRFLKMTSTHVDTGYEEWRIIFDAIRDHQNEMELEFYQIISNDWTEFSFRATVSRNMNDKVLNSPGSSTSRTVDGETRRIDNIRGDFIAYLEKRGTWSRPLRIFFDGEDEDEN